MTIHNSLAHSLRACTRYKSVFVLVTNDIFVSSKEECSIDSEDSYSAECEYAEYTVSIIVAAVGQHSHKESYSCP